jgi:hypothetical protein
MLPTQTTLRAYPGITSPSFPSVLRRRRHWSISDAASRPVVFPCPRVGPRRQQPRDDTGIHGLAEQVALPDLAVPCFQHVQLFHGLDPLGDHTDVQTVREFDDGIDDRRRLA